MLTTNPTELIDQFLTDADRFGDVVATGGDWAGDSPCDGWSAHDVLAHVIDTERDFFFRHGADLGAAPAGSPTERWSQHLDALRPRLTLDLVTTGFDGYFGPTTVGDTLRDFYGFDLLVHRWDLGSALGQEVELDETELDRLEAAVPEPGTPLHAAFYSEGICRPALPVPPGATRQTRVLAAFGRAG
jgi:uncharacterized protein (TIGR03083 family)